MVALQKIIGRVRVQLIHILGGFATKEEAIASFQKEERMFALEEVTASLFTTIGPRDLFHRTQNGFEVGDKFISNEEMKLVVEEARYISQSKTWSDLLNSVRYEAAKKMYYESQDVLDITAGKLLLFQNKILAKRLDDIIHGRI